MKWQNMILFAQFSLRMKRNKNIQKFLFIVKYEEVGTNKIFVAEILSQKKIIYDRFKGNLD